MHIFVFYIVNTVAYMLRGDVHRCVRALSNVASASHSLLLSPCVRQPLNLAELLGGAKDKGGGRGGGSRPALVFALSCFPPAFVVFHSFSLPFGSDAKTPLLSRAHYLRLRSSPPTHSFSRSQKNIQTPPPVYLMAQQHY